jgi:hypothetical protein
MSDTISTTPTQVGDATVATAQPLPPGNEVSGDKVVTTETTQAQGQSQGKTISLPTSAFAKLKAEAAEKGRKAALSDVEQKAKAFGFDSVDAMFKALESTRSGGSSETTETRSAPKPTQQQAKPAGRSDSVSAEALKLAKEMERARKDAEKASRRD